MRLDGNYFDYRNQSWTFNGKYVDCGHPPAGTVMGPGSPAPGELFDGCACYGKQHAGEIVSASTVAEILERHGDA
jgi:hypothetical protein